MKATILLAFCILCGESKLESKLTEASSSALHRVIGTAVRHKRQFQRPGICSGTELYLRVNTAICNPNIGQRFVDIALDCNSYTSNARRFVGLCSRNENGRFCFESQHLSFNYTNAVESNCPSLSSYLNYECSDSCRVALQNFKSNIGCCLNSLFNISADDSRNKYNRAGLWSACSVSPPSICQASTLTLGSGTTSRNCSNAEALEEFYTQIYCNSQSYQPVLDIYIQCESPHYEESVAICGLSERNQLCAVLFNNSYPQAVYFQCQNYTQGCTPSCHAALNAFKAAMGCCVNFYNISGLDFYNVTNPALWSACGIPTPGFCTSTLVSQPTRSPNDSTALPTTTRVPTLSSQPTRSPNDSTALPLTTRAPTLSSVPTSTSESNSALNYDSPKIVAVLVPLVLLNAYM